MERGTNAKWLKRVLSIVMVLLVVCSVVFVNTDGNSAYASSEEEQGETVQTDLSSGQDELTTASQDASDESSSDSATQEIQGIEGSDEQAEAVSGNNDSDIQLTTAEDTQTEAPDLIGTADTANEWQIVDRKYTSNDQSEKAGYDIDGDGSDDIFYQKNVVSTDTENEFLVYIGITKRMTWDELLSESTLGLTTQGKWKDSDVGSLVNESSIGGNKSSELTPGQVDGSRQYLATINLKRNGETVHTYQGWYSGTTPNTSNCTGYILLNGLEGKAIVASTRVNLHQDESGTGGTLEYDIDFDKMLANNICFNIEDASADSITDTMGSYITFENVENCNEGTTSYDESSKTLTWVPQSNGVIGTNVQENDGITGYHYNIHQLVYKVKLNVEQADFNSCADNMNSAVGDAESYKVNENAVLNCSMSANSGQATLQVPYVRGLLYDMAFQKQDSETKTALAGAVFTLYESDGTTPVTVNGNTMTATTGDDGLVRFENIPYGEYIFEETTAPTGYTGRYGTVKYAFSYTTNAENLVQDENNKSNYRISDEAIGTNGIIYNTPKNTSSDITEYTTPPDHSKTIKKLDTPDQYELSLDVTGYLIPPEAADILIVVDKSGSMKNSDGAGSTRQANVQAAVDTLTEQLKIERNRWKTQDQPEVNCSVVEFSSGPTQVPTQYKRSDRNDKGYWYQSSSKPCAQTANDWTSLDDFDYTLGTCTGGTNWQAGVLQANTLMSDSSIKNNGHRKYVIFITDGNPTFRYSYNGDAVDASFNQNTSHTVYGYGSDDESRNIGSTITKCYEAALNQWIASTNLHSSDVYVVQAASIASKCSDFVNAIQDTSKSATLVQGYTKKEMESNFKDLAQEVMHGTSVSNAAIHDKLSDNVEFAEANPTLTVTKTVTDPDTGKSTTTTMTEGTDYTKSVDTTNKTVDIYFTDTYLDANTTYKVSFKVVAKTDTAIEALVSGNGVYPDVGDTGTDAEGNDTSSGKRGLWSNIEDSTYLSYQIDSTDMKNKYKRPVVQIDTVKQTVIKKWSDSSSAAKHNPVEVKIKALVNRGQDVTDEIFIEGLKSEVTLSSSNSWKYVWENLPKYYHYKDSSGDDAAYEITYVVTEESVPDGYISEVNSVTDEDDSSHTITTITNTEITADLDLKKVDSKNGNALDGAVFTLERLNTDTSEWETQKDYSVKDDSVELKKLAIGRYRLTEKTAPAEHTALSQNIYFQVDNSGVVSLTDEAGNTIPSEQQMWTLADDAKTLTIKNNELYSLPSAGSVGIYPFTIGGVVVIMTALLLVIKNKQKEER